MTVTVSGSQWEKRSLTRLKLIIEGETPAKKNSRIVNTKTGRSFPSKRYSEWHKNSVFQVIHQVGNSLQISEPCKISMTFVHGDLRRRDSDNGTSSILDLLTDCGVLKDDNWRIVQELSVKNSYSKGKPYCEVSIEVL